VNTAVIVTVIISCGAFVAALVAVIRTPRDQRGSAELQRMLEKMKPIRALACAVVAAGMLLNEHLHAAPLWRMIVIPGLWALMAIAHLLPSRTRKSPPAD